MISHGHGSDGTKRSRNQCTHLVFCEIELREHVLETDLNDRLCLTVWGGQVSEQIWRVEREGVEVFGSDGVHHTAPSKLGTLRFCFSKGLR